MSEESLNNFTPRAQQVLALARKEAVILDLARAPGFTIAKLAEALKKQEEIH